MNDPETRLLLFILFFILYLSTCCASTPPLSTAHKVHPPGITSNQEKPGRDGGKGEKSDINKTVPEFVQEHHPQASDDVLPPRVPHFFNSLDGDGRGAQEVLRRAYYRPRPRPRNASTPVKQRNVGVEKNVNNLVTSWSVLVEITTPSPSAAPAVLPSASPPSPSSTSSSSCSTLTCAWFYSWQFLFITCLTGMWLLALMSLSFMARTTTGRYVLDALSSCCVKEEADPDNQVLAKGIGYFDGSPGMRRLVLIEDEDDDDDDEEDENSLSSDSQGDVKDTEAKGASVGVPKRVWRPPRKGTYILQEGRKDYVLELGMYRLQEDVEEGVEDDKVEYVLEGPSYILQSERVGSGEGGRGRIENLGLYGLIEGEIGGGGGGGRIGEIEGLYGIIRQGVGGVGRGGGGGGRGRRDDEVILSVKEFEEDTGGGKNVKVEESTSGTGALRVPRLEVVVEGSVEGSVEGAEGGGAVEGSVEGAVEGAEGGGAVEGAVGGHRCRSRSLLPYKRAASFPMDSYTPAHLLPRKLSLILEEEIH